jgi:acyl-CoA synthetase (NDP forming)
MPDASISSGPRGAAAVEPFLRPRSVAIIGVSSRAGSAGMNAYTNFKLNEFSGDIYLVGRGGGEVDGRTVLKDINELPDGVDLAVFTLPAAGVHDAMRACARRRVKAVVIFASGFAEVGQRDAQDELASIAQDGGIALLGPNCLGYTNLLNGVHAFFVSATKIVRTPDNDDPKVAIISASGGLMSHIRQALEQRHVPAAYTISTGNEAGVGMPDFVQYFADDPLTSMIILYVEEVREPAQFLAAASYARAKGKPVVMMHPGRTNHAREAVSSHTGALAGDHAVMRTLVSHAGIMMIDKLDELIDTAEILAHYPTPNPHGPGILTFSGAYCAIAHDFCDEIGLDLPPLSDQAEKTLRAALPGFATPRNPLDLTTQPVWQPELMRIGASALLDDPKIGGLLISIPLSNPVIGVKYLEHTLEAAAKQPTKPMVFSALGEGSPLPEQFNSIARKNKVIVSRSADRSLRALGHYVDYGKTITRAKQVRPAEPIVGLPTFSAGPQPEWLGKEVLRSIGIRVPEGAIARTVEQAAGIAKKIGYPVAMKAQAAMLAHKTEAGGVLLGIADEDALRAGWRTLHDNIAHYQSDLVLDGILVEAMSAKGIEMLVGAKRDPRWGPIIVVGMGGTLVEAIGDIRLLPPDLTEAAVIEEITQLKTAKLLQGFRGAPPADVPAVAAAVVKIGDLIRTTPAIKEIDINPLIVRQVGQGVTALDALIVS